MAEHVMEIVEGPDAGKRFTLGPTPAEIGRDPGAGVELTNDHLVSRRHARLTPSGDAVQVEDLGSRNGTFVNGNQIYSPALVTAGNEITVGVSVLVLRTTGAAAVPETRVVPLALTRVHEARPPAQPASAAPAPPPVSDHVPGGLAQPERTPDFVPSGLHGGGGGESPLNPLLDKHTKRMARTAPLAIFVLVVLVVLIALALR